MRHSLATHRVQFMKYQIREVVDVARHIQTLDPTMNIEWENIGDPIAKSWHVPQFFKQILVDQIEQADDKAFGYSHSRGIPATRAWIASHINTLAPGASLDPEHIVFTNGLGSAIGMMYEMFAPEARIILPTPGYPTHISMESSSSDAPPLLYQLDPNHDWAPDTDDIEAQIIAHPDIVGILVINPNNPTGAVYSKETIEKIVLLAERYQLMILSDEVYFRMVYNGTIHTQISEIANGRVPLLVMRGMSKDVPWPGGRCGWIEFYNVGIDAMFDAYVSAFKQRILMEICATSLPQFIVGAVYDHPEYPAWLSSYNTELEKNGNMIADVLSQTKGLRVNRTNGAFYMMPLFESGVLNDRQTLSIENDAVRAFIEQKVNEPGVALDQRFTYYLLGATGICVVPATGFYSNEYGFRLTTLERDDTKRASIYSRLSDAIETYLNSTSNFS